jgi:hypothetical protein
VPGSTVLSVLFPCCSFPEPGVVLVLCCPQNGRSSPAPGAPVLNLPCPGGLTAPTASAPPLLSPDGVPVRWLLMDGYLYDIRDDQDHPPWQEGRWASMNGVRRPGAKRSPARWRRYDTWREAQDTPGV